MHLPMSFSVGKVFADLKKETESVMPSDVSASDALVLDMTRHEGWKDFNKMVETRIAELKAFVDPEGQRMIDPDGDPALVGVKYLVVSFAIYQLRQMLNYPQALIEYERLQGQQQGEGARTSSRRKRK
jgi:hypothetical protein